MLTRNRTLKALAMTVLTLLLSTFAMAGPMLSQADAYPRYCTTKSKGGTQTTTCIQLTKIYKRTFKVIYRDGVRNPEKGSAYMSCTATVSKTMTYSVSASVKAEAGAIFAKVSGEVSGGVARSVTSGYSTSASKKVPGKKTMFCDRGIYNYKFKGRVTKVTCVSVNCTSSTRNFSGKAPQRALWNLYIGH